MRAALEGDYERGARIARELFERGEREEADGRLLTPIHAQFHGTNLLSLLNERGELGPHAPLFERLARQIAPPGWRPALAWAHVQAGRPELARELIEAMSEDGFASTPRDSNFVARLAQVAHVVAELGDAELAARVEPLLAPYGDFWVVLGPSACTLGPVAYSVGALRLLQDRPAEAAASFELALERSRAMRARPYEARSQAGLAAALRRARRATPAPRSSRRGPPRPRASSGWCGCSASSRSPRRPPDGGDRVFAGFSQRRSRTLAASPPTVPKGRPHDPRRRAQARAPRHLGRR